MYGQKQTKKQNITQYFGTVIGVHAVISLVNLMGRFCKKIRLMLQKITFKNKILSKLMQWLRIITLFVLEAIFMHHSDFYTDTPSNKYGKDKMCGVSILLIILFGILIFVFAFEIVSPHCIFNLEAPPELQTYFIHSFLCYFVLILMCLK